MASLRLTAVGCMARDLRRKRAASMSSHAEAGVHRRGSPLIGAIDEVYPATLLAYRGLQRRDRLRRLRDVRGVPAAHRAPDVVPGRQRHRRPVRLPVSDPRAIGPWRLRLLRRDRAVGVIARQASGAIAAHENSSAT